jgi:hypothetical protein
LSCSDESDQYVQELDQKAEMLADAIHQAIEAAADFPDLADNV